jgi:hypothetical protein
VKQGFILFKKLKKALIHQINARGSLVELFLEDLRVYTSGLQKVASSNHGIKKV